MIASQEFWLTIFVPQISADLEMSPQWVVTLVPVSTCGSSLIVGFLDFHNCKANCVDMMYVYLIIFFYFCNVYCTLYTIMLS